MHLWDLEVTEGSPTHVFPGLRSKCTGLNDVQWLPGGRSVFVAGVRVPEPVEGGGEAVEQARGVWLRRIGTRRLSGRRVASPRALLSALNGPKGGGLFEIQTPPPAPPPPPPSRPPKVSARGWGSIFDRPLPLNGPFCCLAPEPHHLGWGVGQGCIRREGNSEAAPEAVRQAVGGGCQSGWGRLLAVANGSRHLALVGQWLGVGWAPWTGERGVPPSLPMHPWGFVFVDKVFFPLKNVDL